MRLSRRILQAGLAIPSALIPLQAQAAQIAERYPVTIVKRTGVSGLWILANISYAGMRAQSHPGFGWRVVSFIFGFPGTLVSFFAVAEGSGRAYGIDIPKRGF